MSTETVVRERPILFSGPMVRAILDGRKRQTRRVVTSQPEFFQSGDNWLTWRQGTRVGGGRNESAWASHALDRCPYGTPGDRLWVREAWGVWQRGDCAPGGLPYDPHYIYRASNDAPDLPAAAVVEPFRWRPSIHMPRKASRLTLEITDVRVQRVQEISEDDARAEGAPVEFRVVVMRPDGGPNYRIPSSHRGGFANLWNSLNAARGYGWDANPFVWALTFRRVEVET